MDRSLYISSVGLANIERAQTAHANNLANVSTNGFRADLARVMSSEVAGEGFRSRVYGVNEGADIDLSPGVQKETGRDLDIAINGDGLLAVMQENGQEAYTPEGGLQVDSLGRLMTSRGHQVMGLGGPISLPPFESIVFGADGSITIRPQGQGAEALVQIDRLKLVDPLPDAIRKSANGLLTGAEGEVFAASPTVTVNSGFIESSNVNAINELTQILSLARQFELEVKMMKTAETNDEAATQLMRIG